MLGATDHDLLGNSLYVVLEWAGHKVTRATAHLKPIIADAFELIVNRRAP
ncbi:MAG: hypothetical protein WAU75_05225 [Solirubrobacteraceae bacterium]